MKIKIENKEQLIKAARIAKQVPEEKPFWREVEKRMELRTKSLVAKRPIK